MEKARPGGNGIPARVGEQFRASGGTVDPDGIGVHIGDFGYKINRQRNASWQVLKIAKAVSERLT